MTRPSEARRPRIGIPLCLDVRGRWRQGRDYVYSDLAYARAVDAAGASATLLPVQSSPDELLEGIDALLLPGGDDFAPPSPDLYPEDVRFDNAPAEQIGFDAALLAGALERDLPVLGICYGMQLLALEHGGSLHYHLPHDLPRADSHQLQEGSGQHAIRVYPGSRLASIVGAAPSPVNSAHHQAVMDPGPALRASAWSPDGVIEAIEAPDRRFCIGVQWHPEKLRSDPNDGDDGHALFRGLVSAALDV